MDCNVCNHALGEPIFESPADQSLTSLCELRSGRVRVWHCTQCSHLRGEELPDTGEFYESEYRILLDEEEQDQVYEVRGEEIVYRTDHQISTMLSKINPGAGDKLLDYGCAKASTPKRLLESNPDIEVHLFDVSAMYQEYWQRFVPAERCAMHETPAGWAGRFDVVTSFFALEHIPDPIQTVRHVASLLKDDGVFYGIVPDTFGNIADFVVIDHVNHFTAASLHKLFREAGFNDIQIDDQAHRGALVFAARRSGEATPSPDVAAANNQVSELATYWTALSDRIHAAEAEHADQPAAIYGSGFYGAYIASSLREPQRIQCLLDASPFQQGKQLFGHDIIAPTELPESVRVLYVGLNPAIARRVIAEMDWLTKRDISLVFLDEGA